MRIRYRHALAGLFILQTLYFSPLLFERQVIFAHANDLEVADASSPEESTISNRKFADQSSVYIPEINQHLNGRSGTWLSTWNPYVQLGRPTAQLAGFGKAYLITHILSFLTRNPFLLYTYIAVSTVYLTGFFCFLFLKSLGLHPLACFSSAAGLSLGMFFSYWLTFVMFLASVCWTLALLWLVTELIDRRSLLAAAGVSFATYCLLMSGYPQFVILQGYVLAAFTVIRLWRLHDRHASLRASAILAGALLVGVIMALPPYLDVAISAQRSSRLNVSDDFFLAVLPRLQGGKDVILFLSQIVDAFWFGNPIRPDYPFTFDGLSLTPFYCILVLFSITRGQWRRLWPWQLFSVCCVAATMWPPAYLFMVHHLGFHLSKMLPMGGALIPAFVLAAYSLDNLLRSRFTWSVASVLLLLSPLAAVGASAWTHGAALHPGFLGLCLLVTAGTAVFVTWGQPLLVVLLIAVSVAGYGHKAMLARPIGSIHLSSPLVETISRETRDGSRYAKIGAGLDGLLPSNQEVLLQIRGIGSYDTVSSTNYQRLVLTLSEAGAGAYGRSFGSIASPANLGRDSFGYAGVGVLLSRESLDERRFTLAGKLGGLNVYRTQTPPVLKAQLTRFRKLAGGDSVVIDGPLDDQDHLEVNEIENTDDVRRFRLTSADQETVLFVSQQYHPHWKASSRGRRLPTVLINDFYLGVIVPARATEVDLSFRPFVRWSWMPQVIFVAFGVGLLVRQGYSKRILVASRRTR